MSNNKKPVSKAMSYELTNGTKISDTKAVLIKSAQELSSLRLVWILLTRHKVGLLTVGNIILVLNWAIPAWPQIVKSLF